MSKSSSCVALGNFPTNSTIYDVPRYSNGSDDTRAVWQYAYLLPAAFGTVSNAVYIATLSNKRLHTATFVYLRILAIIHVFYCAVLVPLWLTCHLLRVSLIPLFIKLKILPTLIQTTHLLILCIAVCLPSRLIKQIQYLKYLRSWHSHSFIAWRKLLWGIPISICINLVLYFEYRVMTVCNSTQIIANLTYLGRREWFKFWVVRFLPILIYGLLLIVTLSLLLYFLRAFRYYTQHKREWLENITVIKHEHLIRNLLPMVISLVFCYGIAYILKMINLWYKIIRFNSLEEILLFTFVYGCPPIMTLILSSAFRNEFRLQIIAAICKGAQGPAIDQLPGQLCRQNSEYKDDKALRSSMKGQRKQLPEQHDSNRKIALKSALKIDAKQRVRFVTHPCEIHEIFEDSDEEDSSSNDLYFTPRSVLADEFPELTNVASSS